MHGGDVEYVVNPARNANSSRIQRRTFDLAINFHQKLFVKLVCRRLDIEAEGQDEKVGGKIQKKVGDIEKVFEK
jgi:hypothetical protein